MKKILLFIFPLLLIGCKTTIEIPVKLSDFDKKDPSVQIVGLMNMEITSCTERGTDMPSDDVFKLQKKIPYIFKGAEYINCYDKNFRSHVLFKLPVNSDNVKDGKVIDEYMINLNYFPVESASRLLNIYIPKKLGESINKLIKSNMYINASDIAITLEIDPEGYKFPFTAIGVYIDGSPVQMDSYHSDGEKFKITIPTYGLHRMLNDEVFILMLNTKYRK